MSYWIDSHSHLLDERFRENFDEYIKRAIEHNVEKILCICLSKEELEYGFEVKRKHELIDLAFGYHPSDIRELSSDDWDYLVKMAKDDRIIAIGEIGLDYYWDKTFNDLQKEAFIRQIKIADEVKKPILVHVRDAHEDAFNILNLHQPIAKGIMHCYSGSVEMATRYEKLGMYFSFAGPLTFKNAVIPKEVVKSLDLTRMFVETDCPYLTPEPFRGKQNESAYVKYVGEKVVDLKEKTVAEVQLQMMENYRKLFKK